MVRTMAAMLPLLVAAQRRQPQMSYLTVPSVPDPPALLRPLLREVEPSWSSSCDEGCFVAHVDRVVRSAAAKAWAKLDENSDGQLDLEEGQWGKVGGSQWEVGKG